MKKIAQFTLNVPGKDNNFEMNEAKTRYFLSVSGQILELRVSAPVGTKMNLSTSDDLEDDSIIIGATESYYINLENYHMAISKVYFDFGPNATLKPITVEVTYYFEEVAVATIDEGESNMEIIAIKQDIQNLQSQIDKVDNQNGVQSTDITNLKAKVDTNTNKLTTVENSILTLDSKITGNTADIAANKKSIASLTNTVNGMKVESMKSNIEDIENNIKEIEEHITNTNSSVNDLEDQMVYNVETVRHEMAIHIGNSESRFSNLQSRIVDLEETKFIRKYNHSHYNPVGTNVRLGDLPEGIYQFSRAGGSSSGNPFDGIEANDLPYSIAQMIKSKTYKDMSLSYLLEVFDSGLKMNSEQYKIFRLTDQSRNQWQGWCQYGHSDNIKNSWTKSNASFTYDIPS